MTPSPDDDALSWAGDADPTLVHGRDEGDPAAADEQATADTPPGAGSLALIGMGILAGIYLLYTIGWFNGVSKLGNPLGEPLARFMFSLSGWLAVTAPVVWFTLTYWLTENRPRRRLAWLLVGAVLLAPLPFIAGGPS